MGDKLPVQRQQKKATNPAVATASTSSGHTFVGRRAITEPDSDEEDQPALFNDEFDAVPDDIGEEWVDHDPKWKDKVETPLVRENFTGPKPGPNLNALQFVDLSPSESDTFLKLFDLDHCKKACTYTNLSASLRKVANWTDLTVPELLLF